MKRIVILAGMFAVSALPLVCLRAQEKAISPSGVVAPGYSRNSVNATSFRKNSLCTFGNEQYVAFYDPEGFAVVGKRKLGSGRWTLRNTGYRGNVRDAHNVISIMVDGSGVLHMACDHHGSPLHYFRADKPGSLELKPAAMIGSQEACLTYPEFYRLPDGDLLFLYRDGFSGGGNLVLNRYDRRRKQWRRVQSNLIDGERKRNAYPQATVDEDGVLHLSWVWRETPDVATNHDLCYARSRDGGVAWERSDGSKYELPIRQANAEVVRPIPMRSELMNQTSIAAARGGINCTATYWRDPQDAAPQFRLVWFDGRTWRTETPFERKTPFSLPGGGTERMPIPRPQIASRKTGARVQAAMIFRDEERGFKATVAACPDLGNAPWKVFDVTDDPLGYWEPSFDTCLWLDRGLLHVFVQNVGQGDGESLNDMPPQPVRVVELSAKRLFNPSVGKRRPGRAR